MEEKLAALHFSAVSLGNADSIEDVSRLAMETAEKTLGFKWGGIGFVQEDTIRYLSAIGTEIPEGSQIPLDSRSVTVRAIKTQRSQLVSDTRLDPDYVTLSDSDEHRNLSNLAVPVMVGDRVEAVLNFESIDVNAYTEQDQRLLETLAMHVSSALERIRQLDTLERLDKERSQTLIDAERMVTVGRVAAMVGHDLRNPLSAIRNALYLMDMAPEKAGEAREIIGDAVDRMLRMLDEFRDKTRDTHANVISVDLGELAG